MSRQINLFNPLLLKQKKHFSAVAMLQALCVLVLGLALFYAFAAYQRYSLRSQVAELERAHAAARDRFTRLSTELSGGQSGQTDEDLKSAKQSFDARASVLDRMQSGAGESTAGHSAYLAAFAHQALDGLWLTSIQIDSAGRQLTLTGRALQPELLPEYMRRLGREEILKGRPFEKLQMTHHEQTLPGKAAIGYVEFALSSTSNVPVQAERAQDRKN